ncbi:TMEM175 family protein [Lacticaseibacillus parakribbianus]|uniref:TMEM175 family protein n=1 Tax=Lacticaseibacillus parakribbianus TaxID=2970927 RepID=UPI0021CB00AC|nr:TMEM175 family protein [Lacticaseibacillus parakribbianus]
MTKLKTRLDAFSDAIIAIIITIMVLSIPPVLHDSVASYLQLGKSVGIYLISFLFIANIWYQHATAFAEIDTVTYRLLLLDLLFLGPLALMPLLTKMMALNTTRWTVMLYGLLQLLVNWLFRLLAKSIIHLQYTDRSEMRKVYTKIYGDNNVLLSAWSLIALVAGYFWPEAAMFFYLAYPILMFILSATARQQFSEVESLPEAQQKDFEQLNVLQRRDFQKVHQEIMQDAEPLPETWGQWLDSSIDPRRREQLKNRYLHATPEQQARMAFWLRQAHRAGRRQDAER